MQKKIRVSLTRMNELTMLAGSPIRVWCYFRGCKLPIMMETENGNMLRRLSGGHELKVDLVSRQNIRVTQDRSREDKRNVQTMPYVRCGECLGITPNLPTGNGKKATVEGPFKAYVAMAKTLLPRQSPAELPLSCQGC